MLVAPEHGGSGSLPVPFASRRASLTLSDEMRSILTAVVRSRSESVQRVERARILLAYADGRSVSAIARELETNRPKVERCIDKGLQLGALAALSDLPRKGRPGKISAEARAWVVSLACVKPKQLGYPEELWTTQLLARHVRERCQQAGHPSLGAAGAGHGVEDPVAGPVATAQDRVLSGEARSRSSSRRWPKCLWCTSLWSWRTSGRKPMRSPGRRWPSR